MCVSAQLTSVIVVIHDIPNHDVVVKEHNISDSPRCKIIQTAAFLGLNF